MPRPAATTSRCRPPSFPVGTEPFDDPLGAFCAQVHVSYAQPELSLTRDGGGSAFAGWESGKPFYGNICFPDVPDPLPPDEGTAVVTKVGELVGGDVVFTVTATNPTTEIAPDVVVLEALPAKLTPWTVPPECTLSAVDFIARCEIGDLAGGASFDLVFSATPPADVCGSFSNYALTTVGSPWSARRTSSSSMCPARRIRLRLRSAHPDDQGRVVDLGHGPGHGLLLRDLRERRAGTGDERELHR